MAKYAMDVSLSVYQVPIYGSDLKISGFKWKATVRATSFVSSSGAGTVLTNAQVSLMAGGMTFDTKQLKLEGDVLIRGGGQYTYVGEATFDLPSIATLQIGITGGWVIQYDQSNRFVPISTPYLGSPIGINGVMNVNRSGQ